MKILVTGAGGFVGRHLAADLAEAGHELILTSDRPGSLALSNGGEIELRPGDIRDRTSMGALFRETVPDAVVHLAAISQVVSAQSAQEKLSETNIIGTHNVCAAAAALQTPVTFLFASTSLVYGAGGVAVHPSTFAGGDAVRVSQEKGDRFHFGHLHPMHNPMEGVEALSEHSFPAPETAYGASKLAGEYIVRSYASEMFRPYIVRAFNHIGPGQGGDFVCPTLARKIVAAPDGGRITVGNLKVYRDFTDVRDVVRAYRLILEVKPAQDLFVIGSGRAVRIEEVLEELARISGKEITAEVDRSLVRNVDPPLLCADSSLAQHVLGWSPAIPMEQTLREVYGEAARLLPQHNGKARGGRPAAGC